MGPCRLSSAAKGAIVDEGAPDGGDAPGLAQRRLAHQHAAAGRRGRPLARIVDPGERVKLHEEEHEGGHQQSFPETFTAEQGQQRNEVASILLRPRDQAAHVRRIVFDVGIGQQQVAGVRQDFSGGFDPLRDGPQLPRPAGFERSPRDHRKPVRPRRRGPRDACGPVVAAVVDKHDREPARIVLGDERADGLPDRRGLIAGRDDRHHRRPFGPVRGGLGQPLGSPPEAPTRNGQDPPQDQRQAGKNGDHGHGRYSAPRAPRAQHQA